MSNLKTALTYCYFWTWILVVAAYQAIKSSPIKAHPKFDGSQTVKFNFHTCTLQGANV